MPSTLIKNGLVYDGSGAQPFKSDVLVHNNRIARIGSFRKTDAKNVIDASNAIVVPGFIDINSKIDCNPTPFSENFENNNIFQGVTTILGGNGGVSLAPVSIASLRFIKDWFGISEINVDWHSLKEYLNFLERKPFKINFGTLLGQVSTRIFITGAGEIKDLTEKELSRFKKIISSSLDDGAFGVSVDLSNFHPIKFNFKEIKSLVEIVAEKRKVISLKLSFNNENSLLQKTEEDLIKIAGKNGSNIEINCFNPLKSSEKFYLRFKNLIEKERANIHINFDCHSLDYSSSPIYDLLPWSVKDENFRKMVEAIHLKHFEKQLLSYFKKYETEEIEIYDAPKSFKFFVGKNLKELTENFNLNFPETILRLMRITNLGATLTMRNVNSKVQKDFFCSENSIIASDNFYSGVGHHFPFLNFLKLANNFSCLSLEKAFAKITSIPAQKYGIKKRGLIADNYYADIVVLRDFVPSEVLLNGKIVMSEGKINNVFAGKILRAEKKY